jgi:predicted nucleotidyltransferase
MKSELIAFAMDFASFLLEDEKISKKLDNIILFGSVARGEADSESDVDIFIDTKYKIKADVEKMLSLFNSSRIRKDWELKGVKNDISVKVGRLDDWKSLRRSILSSSILLYGKFKQLPENIEYYILFTFRLDNIRRKDKVGFWRRLYGYRQRVKDKEYLFPGLLKSVRGKKIGKNAFLVTVEAREEVRELFRKFKIDYQEREVWT